jgi:hypothetical protein
MSLSEGRHWFDTETIRNRLEFHLHGYNGDTNTSYLTLSDVRSSDAGMYRCRVDFKMSPTRNARVNLKIYGIIRLFVNLMLNIKNIYFLHFSFLCWFLK